MLILAGTPIGNLADASPRLRQALTTAHTIAAEDTRKTRQLLQLLEITTAARLVALHDHNEHAKAQQLATLAGDADVVLVSDAGMPTVSDPGYRVVAAAVAQNTPLTVIPGPSAPLAALAVSGLPTDRFTFEGFLPRKPSELRSTLEQLQRETRTMIFFESPQRIGATVTQMAEIFGATRPLAICRELTKMHEEVLRGTAAELAATLQNNPLKGEIVLVVSGAEPPRLSPAAALAEVTALVHQGSRLKDACREVAAATGLSSRELYQQALAAKQDK